MATLELTQGFQAIVDDELIGYLSDFKWFTRRLGSDKTPYASTKIDGKSVLLHRFLLLLETGDKRQGDHINGDTLDNRIANLRVVDHSGNMRNQRRAKNNTSGKVGIHYKPKHGPAGAYTAYAMVDGKLISKTFGCLKRGKEQAFHLASNWRNEMEKSLNITVRGNLQ